MTRTRLGTLLLRELLVYWLIVQVAGILVGIPLAVRLFPSLPDRGYSQAKTLGLLVVAVLTWLLTMLGLTPFGAPAIVVVALGVGALIWHYSRSLAILSWARSHIWPILGAEGLFLLALGGMATVRATNFTGADFTVAMFNPDPVATERPMDFAFFHAIQRSTTMPPHDPWLAGYSINYYYLGYLVMAAVALLSGLPPGTTYNLSLALLFALAALGIAGLLTNLIVLAGETQRVDGDVTPDRSAAPEGDGQVTPRSTTRRIQDQRLRLAIAGVVAAIVSAVVLLGGNLAGAAQALAGDERVVALDGRGFIDILTQRVQGRTDLVLAHPVRTDDFGMVRGWTWQPLPASFDSWWTSRVLWDERPAQDEQGQPTSTHRYAITEFPAFSFMLGDMHPHVLSLPFCVLALSVGCAIVARSRMFPRSSAPQNGVPLLLTAGIIGALYAINSWDYPTYLLLIAGALVLYQIHGSTEATRAGWRPLALQIGVLVALSIVLFAPFHLTFRSFAGAEPTTPFPILRALSATLGGYTGDRTDLYAFMLMFGPFALPILWYLCAHPCARLVQLPRVRHQGVAQAPLLWLLSGLFLGTIMGFPLLALLPAGIIALQAAARCQHSPADAFALLGIALGCFISVGTELIYVRDVFEGWQPRFNTIFKFSYQTWLIWGVLSGYCSWWIMTRRAAWKRVSTYIFAGMLTSLLAGATIYPQQTYWRVLSEGQFIGINGRTLREQTAAGQASLDWLRTQAPAGRVVLEAVGPAYDATFGAVAGASGLPTVLAWPSHQGQWRNGNRVLLDEVAARERDVETIYSTLDRELAQQLLQRYRVRYVYIGPAERGRYSGKTLAKFAEMGTTVFQQDDVVIYELPEGEATPILP